ncbi:hypothetical protein GRI42_03145 [Erythrobacter gaetbuli]|uniref:Spore coat protein U domain-containing protein n=1 Tax=Qipengyuania gaetbuli TaxID=266952 RepID=A0A844XXK4_9SPHN|nr:hypothetical protein [Qipengyuania gaetbuli]MXO50296.1 hypothetical protein [Qipengyuania gaetbuli]
MRKRTLGLAAAASGAVLAAPIAAEPVAFDASLLATCSLIVSDGALAPNTDYTSLSSENSGGAAATVTVTALGSDPTLSFGAPTITSTNDVSGISPQIRYTSLDGASQAYTSAQSTSTSSDLADVYTVHAKAEDPGGFAAGDYSIVTVVTCSG